MANKENKSKYWIRKFHEKGWEDFRELEVGSVFETSVSNHVQMADITFLPYLLSKSSMTFFFIPLNETLLCFNTSSSAILKLL